MSEASKTEIDGAHGLLKALIWGPFEHELSGYLQEGHILEEMRLSFRSLVMLWNCSGKLHDELNLKLGDVHSIAE